MKIADVTKHSFNITSVTEELGKDTVSRNSYLGAILTGMIMLIAIILVMSRLPNRVPLLLTNPWGEERLVGRQWLLTGPLLVWGVVVFNLALAKSWNGEGTLVPRILAISSLVIALMLTTALWGMLQSFFL